MLALLALGAEGLLRLLYHTHSRRFIHPFLGETYKPGFSASLKTPEGKPFTYTLNNIACRGPDIPPTKPGEAFYVFAIGGSTTICNEYPDDQIWTGVLQAELHRLSGNTNIVVFNAGMAGASSFRSLLVFQHLLIPLRPDLVILYHGINDKDGVRPTSARYFRDIGYREAFFHRPSFLLQELARITGNRLVIRMKEALEPPSRPSGDYAYHEKNYRDMAFLARGHDIPLTFMTQPIYRRADEMQAINDSTRQLGLDLGVPVFDLARDFPDDRDHFLSDAVHYTVKGNAFIGRQLAEWIVNQDLLRNAHRHEQ